MSGVESGEVSDDQMSSSSSYSSSVVASRGRLNSEEGGGAWCPRSVVTNSSREWLEVSLESEVRVTGVIVQGRYDRGLGQEWAQSVRIQVPGDHTWVNIGDQRPANTDTFTPVLIPLVTQSTGVRTDKIRVVPVTDYPRTVCLRIELCGCLPDDDDELLESFADYHDEVHDVKEELNLRTTDIQEPVLTTRSSNIFKNSDFMSVVIGVLVTVIIILTAVIIFILYHNNRSFTTTTTTTAVLPPQFNSYAEYQPPSNYSNDSYTEYSRPLLQGLTPTPGNKLLWDISFPPPPPVSASPSPKHHRYNQPHHQQQHLYNQQHQVT